ncbi:glycerophosphotransferase [Piscirickettsia salmonis]|uniref:CDP-glycerol:poly(Glycerophosphate) glycerophosphotransferase n=2 Tax=Piscirickettsia salmonis TaxID=1238 RepID=A0A9Q6LPR4_PISSA|nr:CDP-glycerol glycerophosphotransferase family protein [Piscirickettsia salmonis]ALA26425.1 poly(glycerophosphate) glycerophosphotransferase family protein [Piscirickettsia salmonis]APS43850.1 glycerophosphotransferase [Piscirickettsia salmonis]APS47204.1 glycerophosphotransferase [Piscirickettsia salmonis]APS51356.1 glycerophosphotransferase [Piscirickettsia salmonis]APS54565.1 glycerophosphotransferase [Piscirickettsia salmonis]
MRCIVKLFIFPLMNILYLISLCVPKKDNLWVFGAWFGNSYADNSKYLFEYVCANKKEIDCIWISKNKHVVEFLQGQGKRVYYYLSMQGIWLVMRSQAAFITCSKGDIFAAVLTPRHYVVQLWHGTPLKKIVYDDRMVYDRDSILHKIKTMIFPFLKIKFSLVVSPSQYISRIFSGAFRMRLDKCPVLGYPRNDILSNKRTVINNSRKQVILYAPTFREHELTGSVITIPSAQELAEVNDFLVSIDKELRIRLHPAISGKVADLFMYSRISLSTEADIQLDLKQAEILISDYSSLIYDYLLTDRPIIQFAPDLDEYLASSREMYHDYEKIAAGPIAHTWSEVLVFLSECLCDPKRYAENRKYVRELFNAYNDDLSSERVYQFVYKMLYMRH